MASPFILMAKIENLTFIRPVLILKIRSMKLLLKQICILDILLSISIADMGEESEALMAGRFFLFLYRSLWEIFALIVPAFANWRSYKGKEDSTRLHERYGISKIPRPQNIQRLYWLHGVSVGESVSSLVLGIALLKADPDSHILITSNTLTSQHMLRNRIKELES